MKVYRIVKTRYINGLSGNGAGIYGGRWNHNGTKMVYASESRSLATVEYLVHVPLSFVPTNLSLATLQIPNGITQKKIKTSDLPNNWRKHPAPLMLAEIGTKWATKKESLLLRVPSAVVEHEFNILINPLHPEIQHISIFQIERYFVDNRLL